jgi:hypothetical protein
MDVWIFLIAANLGALLLVMFFMWFSSRLTRRVKLTVEQREQRPPQL